MCPILQVDADHLSSTSDSVVKGTIRECPQFLDLPAFLAANGTGVTRRMAEIFLAMFQRFALVGLQDKLLDLAFRSPVLFQKRIGLVLLFQVLPVMLQEIRRAEGFTRRNFGNHAFKSRLFYLILEKKQADVRPSSTAQGSHPSRAAGARSLPQYRIACLPSVVLKNNLRRMASSL